MLECDFDASSLNVFFNEMVESRREVVGEAAERIMNTVRAMPCARDSLDDLALALTEALANAIIHGNREDPNKRVNVWGACERNERLLLVITDEGQGFDVASIPDPTVAENIFCTHGRGVFLINRLIPEAEYRLGGRQVVLRKKV
jgi:serine/threonine-protein kinase RsbW